MKKCPYCDFNSHTLKRDLPEETYINMLLADFDSKAVFINERAIQTIFMGGGTPSLFSADALAKLFTGLKERVCFAADIEITLEANPGTLEAGRFAEYHAIGINRLSIGIQSFSDEKLKTLGRIHSSEQAVNAVHAAHQAHFSEINLDLMHTLPAQSVAEALNDLEQAVALKPTHLSWYQLTLEPNTLFYQKPPELPNEGVAADIFEQGTFYLKEKGFDHYEVSAYAKPNPARHNLNYWQFGDYLGIGAGAHSKVSLQNGELAVRRLSNFKHPKQYMTRENDFVENAHQVGQDDLLFEAMLNGLRLIEGLSITTFEAHTGLKLTAVRDQFFPAEQKGLLEITDTHIKATALGQRYLNDLVGLFLG